MHLRGDKMLGLASNIDHILMPKQWWFRALRTLKDEHLKSYTIKCIIKVCSFHENVSHSLGLYCHNKPARELQSETENPGKEIRFSMIVFCYKLNTKNERLFFAPSSLGCFLKMQIKCQAFYSHLVFYTMFLHYWKEGGPSHQQQGSLLLFSPPDAGGQNDHKEPKLCFSWDRTQKESQFHPTS